MNLRGAEADLRLRQLNAQANALRESLYMHGQGLSLTAGAESWPAGLVASMFAEVNDLLPDPSYFRHIRAGMDLAKGEWATTLKTAFDIDAILSMIVAATAEFTGVQRERIGFRPPAGDA